MRRGDKRGPDPPARQGPERLDPGNVYRASTVLGPGLQGQMGQNRLHLPASSGMLRRPQPGWRSARPTAPGCFTAPLASGDWFANLSAPTDWFSPWKRRDAYTSRAADLLPRREGDGAVNLLQFPGPSQPPPRSLQRTSTSSSEIGGSVRTLWPEGPSPESRSAAPTRKFGVLSPLLSMHV